MNIILLQGDVGSGKTIVAFIAIYANYLSKYQSALMAPTEKACVPIIKSILPSSRLSYISFLSLALVLEVRNASLSLYLI